MAIIVFSDSGNKGPIVTSYDKLNFLSEWKKVSIHGKQNCGIYISDVYPDRILKCTQESRFKTMTNTHNIGRRLDLKGVHIIPYTYNIYAKKHDNIYVEMERMTGSVKQLIYDRIPKMVLDGMDVDDHIKSDIWFIYTRMSPFFKDNHVTKNLKKLKKATYLTYNIYESFMNRTMDSINDIIPTLRRQIIMTRVHIYLEGYKRTDNHLNNYAYTLSDSNDKHMNINWNHNKLINDKFLKVYMIDFDSLSEKDESTTYNIVEKYNKPFLKAYEIEEFAEPLVPHKTRDFPAEIIKILTTRYTLQPNDQYTSFRNIREVVEDIIGTDNNLLNRLPKD